MLQSVLHSHGLLWITWLEHEISSDPQTQLHCCHCAAYWTVNVVRIAFQQQAEDVAVVLLLIHSQCRQYGK